MGDFGFDLPFAVLFQFQDGSIKCKEFIKMSLL